MHRKRDLVVELLVVEGVGVGDGLHRVIIEFGMGLAKPSLDVASHVLQVRNVPASTSEPHQTGHGRPAPRTAIRPSSLLY